MRLRRRTVFWLILAFLVLAVLSPIAIIAFYFETMGGAGSPSEAARLKEIVERIPDPESGQGVDPQYAAMRFKDGEWVLGIGRDSHGWMSKYRGGGTIVVKDSRGRVRCFFGHLCGSEFLGMCMSRGQSLDEFYKNLTEYGNFTEYGWP